MTEPLTMAVLPDCELCRCEDRTTQARFDAAMKFGPRAYVCADHYVMYGVGGVATELRAAGEPGPTPLCAGGLTDEEHLCAELMLGACPRCGPWDARLAG